MGLTFTQGDTGPDVEGIIHAEDDITKPTDLTGATVRFQMRLPEGNHYKVNALATIIDPVAGSVAYPWGANDLARPETYDAQWEVTFPGGKVITTNPPVSLVVRRQ